MLSVYTRHAEDCKHYRDKLWRRCNCPKWIWGSHNGEFVRMSARTRLWDDAERLRHQMEFPETTPPEPEILPPSAPLPPTVDLSPAPAAPQLGLAQKPRVTIKAAVNAYLADAVSRELAPSTISKLETMSFPQCSGVSLHRKFFSITSGKQYLHMPTMPMAELLHRASFGDI
jgi:integrase/recombinase XerD